WSRRPTMRICITSDSVPMADSVLCFVCCTLKLDGRLGLRQGSPLPRRGRKRDAQTRLLLCFRGDPAFLPCCSSTSDLSWRIFDRYRSSSRPALPLEVSYSRSILLRRRTPQP